MRADAALGNYDSVAWAFGRAAQRILECRLETTSPALASHSLRKASGVLRYTGCSAGACRRSGRRGFGGSLSKEFVCHEGRFC